MINARMAKPAGAINMKDLGHFIGVLVSIWVIGLVIAIFVGPVYPIINV